MTGKIRFLGLLWLITGCTATLNWNQIPVNANWQQNGWDTTYYRKINDYEMFIFSGQKDDQLTLMLFCSSDPYRQSWDKIIISYAADRIYHFTFASKENGQWITGYTEETKRWQDSDFNCLREEKNLKDLPIELKLKILQALQYGDNKYFAPPPGRSYPAPSRLTKLG